MIVRRAAEVDVEAIAAMAERSYRTAFEGILEQSVLATRNAAFFEARFRDAMSRMCVAVEGPQVLGFTLVTDSHIDMIFVDPAAVGTGAGSALLAQAEAEGARSLECFRDNFSARRFYERRGWRMTRDYAREFLGRERAFVFYEKG